MPCISGLRIRSCAARGTPSLTPSCTTMAAGKFCNIWGRVGRPADGSIPFAIAVILRPASGSIGRSPLSEGGPLPQARIPVQQTPVILVLPYRGLRNVPGSADQLVRPVQERQRQRQAKRLRRLQIDHQGELVGSLYGQVGWGVPLRILSTKTAER
jgi:hypothetical protein